MWFIPESDQIIHVVIGGLAIASVVKHQYQKAAGIAFHAVLGGILFIWPSLLSRPVTAGAFDDLHTLLQRYAAAFHFGFAAFAYKSLNDTVRTEPGIHFAKVLTSGFLFFSQLLTAHYLSETNARGVRFNHRYLLPILLIDGVWFGVEVYKLIKASRKMTDEIDILCKHTQICIEGRWTPVIENVFLVDSALSFIYALSNFAFPNQILKQTIKNSYLLDGAHKFYSRQFGSFMLFSAIVSLLAARFTIPHQKNYVLQRLVTQITIVILHLFGHFWLGVFDIAHCTPFVISLLYVSLLVSIHFKVISQEDDSISRIKLQVKSK
ncbi:hypothetical protein FO519_005494 [Halicephalobus sp. NKZ332]|nr:hypothetical protein FO519_005494 [Halicephalobus sp. NKZ332]